MAVEGGTTVGYKCKLVNGVLTRTQTTALKIVCVKPLPAVVEILKGEAVTVAGFDVAVVARLVELEHAVQRMSTRLSEIDVEL